MSKQEKQAPLPDGWRWVRIGSIAAETWESPPSGTLPQVLSVTKYDGFVASLSYFKKQVFSRDTGNYKYVKRGQFAYSTIHLDEGAIARLDDFDGGLISPMYTTFEISDTVDGKFLAYLLKSPLLMNLYQRIGQGTVDRRKSISFDALSKLLIPLPPLPVQRWIAEALASIDRLIEASEAELEALKSFRQECLEEEISSLIKKYPKVPLTQLGILQTGLQVGKKYNSPLVDYPYLRVANVKDGYLDLSTVKTIAVSEQEARRRMLSPGDVLMTEGGDADKLGRGCIWQGEIKNCLHQNHVFSFRPNKKKLIPEFFSYLLKSGYARSYFLASAKQSTNLASINSTQLKAFPCVVPSIKVQLQFIKTFETFDIQIQAESIYFSQLHTLKRGLLHQLLSGKLEPVQGWASALAVAVP